MKATPRTAHDIGKAITNYTPKPFKFPEGMVIIQDTREALPLFTRLPKGLTIRSEKLDTGDYSLAGFQKSFCVERKMISDLISFCTSEREKTKQKLERMKKMDWSALVIEAKESDLYRPYLNSSVSPEVIRQSLVSFSIRWGVHIYIGSRENCCRFILDHCIKFYRIKKEL
jgi:ERCC4-type nuclease